MEINPVQELKPISLVDRGSLKKIHGISAISNLPGHVAERQKEQALRRIRRELRMDGEITILDDVPSNGQGSFLFLLAEYEGGRAGFSSLGVRGKPAEKVADEAVDSLKDYMELDGCVDPHLADQLVPFMALTKRNSSFSTTQMTGHLLTNIWLVERFQKVNVRKWGENGSLGGVEFLNE